MSTVKLGQLDPVKVTNAFKKIEAERDELKAKLETQTHNMNVMNKEWDRYRQVLEEIQSHMSDPSTSQKECLCRIQEEIDRMHTPAVTWQPITPPNEGGKK